MNFNITIILYVIPYFSQFGKIIVYLTRGIHRKYTNLLRTFELASWEKKISVYFLCSILLFGIIKFSKKRVWNSKSPERGFKSLEFIFDALIFEEKGIKNKKSPGLVRGYILKRPRSSKLLYFNFSTCFFQFTSDIISFCFRYTFFNCFRSAIN